MVRVAIILYRYDHYHSMTNKTVIIGLMFDPDAVSFISLGHAKLV